MSAALPREKPDFRAQLRDVPHKPGIYLMRDRLNRVIYVGKARDLRKRVGQYFMPSKIMTADRKTRALLESIWAFEVHTVNSEPESLLLEGRLIKEYRPRYNISFRDDKRFLLVKVDTRDQWPRFRLTRMKGEEGARYFGPFAHAGALRQTMAFLRKKFGVLTFGRGNPTERELKSSTYQVPMKLADITTEQYRDRVEKAAEFLEGRSKEMLDVLETEMKEAAAKLDFERAVELRDMLDDLRRTTATTRKFTRSLHRVVPSTVAPQADMAALKDALQLNVLPRHMECFDISNISTTHIVASMVCFKEGVPDRANYRRYRIATVAGQNDFASMAEVIRRRYSRVLRESSAQVAQDTQTLALAAAAGDSTFVDVTGVFSQEAPEEQVERAAELREQAAEVEAEIGSAEEAAANPEAATDESDPALFDDVADEDAPSPDGTAAGVNIANQSPNTRARAGAARSFAAVRLPDLVIVDGGKGQLSSACKELQVLGLSDLPIIGLAKEFEEIYRPGRPLPLLLPHDSGALKLLQRIRDEAHRFANGYHQLLMKRRINESLLDDCPGVSQHRKELLLRAFGSVARIKKATPDQIAEVSGIGPKLAEMVFAYLKERG